MTRAWLRDDVGDPLLDDVPAVRTHLDQDAAFVGVTVFPTVTVKARVPIGYDWRGDQEFGWEQLVEDEFATLWEQRDELDDLGGRTAVTAKCVVLYTGSVRVDETAVVVADPGGAFRVTNVSQTPDRLELQLRQVVPNGGS